MYGDISVLAEVSGLLLHRVSLPVHLRHLVIVTATSTSSN